MNYTPDVYAYEFTTAWDTITVNTTTSFNGQTLINGNATNEVTVALANNSITSFDVVIESSQYFCEISSYRVQVIQG